MKDFLKTVILVSIVFVLIIISYLVIGNIKHGVELFTRTNLQTTDPTISILMNRLETINFLRSGKKVNSKLTSEEIIEFTLDNLTESDYSEIQIEANKIVCIINDQVKFTSQEQYCHLIVINNNIFQEYQNKYFGLNSDIEFNEIKYHGYYCKNSGNEYYCQKSPYTDYNLNYQLFENAYEEKDHIVLRAYYLKIDATDTNTCNKYFNDVYCNDYQNMTKPTLNNNTIKEDGVLYEYIFKKNNTSYYLESYYVVSEG